MNSVFLPQPPESCFEHSPTAPAAITQWQTALHQATRQWLRIGGDITEWLEAYQHLQQDILLKVWKRTVPEELRSQATYISLGSSARAEDLLSSDLDYALLLGKTLSGAYSNSLRPCLFQFAQTMARFGVQPCSGDVMATNPRWSGTHRQWQERIDSYFQHPNWDNTRYLFILLDSLAVHSGHCRSARSQMDFESSGDGDNCITQTSKEAELWHEMRQEVARKISGSPYLCWEMAYFGIHNTIPSATRFAGLFPSRKVLNIKTDLVNPIVRSIRLLAIQHSISALPTQKRLKALAQQCVLDRPLTNALKQALEYGWKMRVLGALAASTARTNPDEVILSKSNVKERDELMTHVQSARQLERIVHRNFRKPR